jgi:starvation-inducible DNA-binding protein
MFTTLHTLFETQYTELALAVDEIAERIRTLGAHSPGSYSELAGPTVVPEVAGHARAEAMIRNLIGDQEAMAGLARAVINSGEAGRDQATTDLATRRLDVHEKNAWMLPSHLEE